ncbi:peroxidase 45-like [Chenopodium quinoa]|uniref:peroxidase 45-like n=1 Tax=Chenopodium quinoa TaxID=63459 RepID=UPI000B77FF99|nr:peroxidase 45-like [Chenopodium quinoa]
MVTNCIIFLLTTLIYLLILSPNQCSAQLKRDYYRDSCPNVESIVRNSVKKKLQETFVTGPATLRLFFHDCFIQGCDASVILASRTGDAEKDAEDDLSLAGDGFDTVIRAKEAVESVPECKNKVSCADILALATRDVILLSGGPKYGVELGRKDGRISTKASVGGHLPQAHFNYKQLRNMFASHGLSEVDLIALSGAHTLGFTHCSQFSKRIYNYNSQSSIDPTLNQGYAKQLQKACPRDVDPRVAVPLDPASPLKFDNSFYKSLQQGKGLLASDQALYSTRKSKRVVNAFASNSTLFERIFVSSMTRLGRLGVKTGNQGEIRKDCRVINS